MKEFFKGDPFKFSAGFALGWIIGGLVTGGDAAGAIIGGIVVASIGLVALSMFLPKPEE